MEPEYKASEEQVKSLVEKSTKCEQSINIDCANTPLKTLSGKNAWWTDYRGKVYNMLISRTFVRSLKLHISIYKLYALYR